MAVTSPWFQFPKSSPSSAFLPSFYLEPWADCKFSFPGRAHDLCKFYPFSLSLCLELNTNNSVGICWLILIVISIRYRIPTNQPLLTSGRESLDGVNYGGKVHMGMDTTISLHDSNCGCTWQAASHSRNHLVPAMVECIKMSAKINHSLRYLGQVSDHCDDRSDWYRTVGRAWSLWATFWMLRKRETRK